MLILSLVLSLLKEIFHARLPEYAIVFIGYQAKVLILLTDDLNTLVVNRTPPPSSLSHSPWKEGANLRRSAQTERWVNDA